MTTLYDIGYDLAEQVERIQDLLAEGASSESEEVQLLLEGMVAKEGEWKEKSKRVAKFVHQMMLEEKLIATEAQRLSMVKENPWSVVVKNEEEIPSQFKREKTTVEVDKRALLNARESITDIKGIEFIRTKKLAFK